MGPGDNNLVTVAQRRNSGARKIKAQVATIRSKIRLSTGSSMRNIETFAGMVSKMNNIIICRNDFTRFMRSRRFDKTTVRLVSWNYLLQFLNDFFVHFWIDLDSIFDRLLVNVLMIF